MRILCLGDVIGSPGRAAIKALVPKLIEEQDIDFVIVNAENAAAGRGLSVEIAKELLEIPVDVLTSGNHIWKFKEIHELLKKEPRLLRPMNYPSGVPGQGYGLFEPKDGGVPIGVINLQGRIFMDPLSCPFSSAISAWEELRSHTKIIIIDFHAEATSEKRALGWYMAGKVSAVLGTHTHVPTADEEILPGGTAYITDLGMSGPYDSIIGMKKEAVMNRFLTFMPEPFAVAKHDVRLCGVLLEIDPETGKTTTIERIKETWTNDG